MAGVIVEGGSVGWLRLVLCDDREVVETLAAGLRMCG